MNKLLIKIPTRERGFNWLHSYIDKITNPNTRILLSLDEDDFVESGFDPFIKSKIIYTRINKSKGKIEAINRDIKDFIDGFDVLMIGSDDMIPQVKGFDQIVLDDMAEKFPDGDGCLWYKTEDAEVELKRRSNRFIKAGSDEFLRKWICMLPIMGKTYYNRFGFVYHSSYKSFFCDNEQTDVARKLDKIKYIDNQIVKHMHPSWSKEGKQDNLYKVNEKNWTIDRHNYNQRKMRGFPTP